MRPPPARQPDDDLPFPPDAFDPVLLDPGAEHAVVRLGDPGELAAALPHLVGFVPEESLVLVALGGTSGSRVGLTARVDLPPLPQAAALARAMAARLHCEDPDAAVLLIASEAPDVPGGADDGDGDDSASGAGLPHRDLVHQVVVALEPYGIALRDALLVRAGRWWSYDCPHTCCAPGAGTPVPAGTSPLAAASVAAGQVLAGSREELAARIGRRFDAAGRMAAVVVEVGEDLAGLVEREGRDAAAELYTAWVAEALLRCDPGAGPHRPTDVEVARVVWGLRDVRVRDRALGLALGPSAAAAEQLWTECTRRAPVPLDAAPATLLAVSAWLRGDGAMARIALDRALDSEPHYALAALLAQGLDAGLSPGDLRAMVGGTQADLDARRRQGPDEQGPDEQGPDEQGTAADRVRGGRAAPTAARGRARPGTPARSRTRRRRSQG